MKYHDEVPDAILLRYKNRIAQFCSILNQQLEGREYLCGEYSIADIALYPWMLILDDMADIKISNYPNLNAWEIQISHRISAYR